MSNLLSEARHYGCTHVVPLEHGLVDPGQLDYIDLLPKGRKSKTTRKRPTPVGAVAEYQGVALLYLVDDTEGKLSAEERLKTQDLLANRSDPAWLGIVKSGSLEVYPIGFRKAGKSLERIKVIDQTTTDAPLFFQSLVQGTFSGSKNAESADYVFRKIFGLLIRTSEAFVPDHILEPLDVLSMAGRALFFRFLIDRNIVRESELDQICEGASGLKDVFSSAEKATRTSVWLDETFNGDFLTLIDEQIPVENSEKRLKAYRKFYRETGKDTDGQIFNHLTAILRGWEVQGDLLQSEFDWGDLNFAHIPVGVLSQVYESFSHLDDANKSVRNSVHYTPRIIANLMVDQVFASSSKPADSTLLDPSCGAGIFLVLAFRRLIAEKWLRDGERPGVRAIQDTLYHQLRGFDVSESALRLAALSLYITAIEVNATPYPPKSLKFPENLRNSVLYHFGSDEDDRAGRFGLGSLQDSVARDFANQFDIVIGNPPWTRLHENEAQSTDEAEAAKRESGLISDSDRMNAEFTRIGREVFRERGLDDLAERYESPNKNPDLPFIWRATQWAKEGGIISFALHARILTQSGQKRVAAWKAITHNLTVTGLINGADLRWSSVWEINVPWAILFARNRPADEDYKFYFSAPKSDPEQNKHARFRIDYESAAPVPVSKTLECQWLLKALSLGTYRDVELMETILSAFPETLEEGWARWDQKGEKTGQGFNLSPKLKQKPAEFLGPLPVFKRPLTDFSIRFDELKSFRETYGYNTAYRPKTEVLYQSPLVIIPQSPGENPQGAQAFRSSSQIAFSQSFYGYSTADHPQAEILAALIYLLAHSTLFRFFCLMTSVRTGFDRQTFNKNEFDALPFPQIENLPAKARRKICKISDQLEFDETKPWEELDALIFELYGLDADDVQLAKDTLFSSASYRKEGRAAYLPPSTQAQNQFRDELRCFLQPFFKVCGQTLQVCDPDFEQDVYREPWLFLMLSNSGNKINGAVPAILLEAAMEQANKSGSSRIVIRLPENEGLLLGLLTQQRWWTRTRAKMCGQHILRDHLDAFGIKPQEVTD